MAPCVTDSYPPSASPTFPPSASRVVISHGFFFFLLFVSPARYLCGFWYAATVHRSCSSYSRACPTPAPASWGAGKGAVSRLSVTAVDKAFWKVKPTTRPRHCWALEGDCFRPMTWKTLSLSCRLWAASFPERDAAGNLWTAPKQHLPWHCKHPAVHLVLLRRAAVWKFFQLLCLSLCSRHEYLACCLLHHQILLNHRGFWSCHLCLHCDF